MIVSVHHFHRHVVISPIANVKMTIRAWLVQNVRKDLKLQAFLPEQYTCRQCFQDCQPCNVPQGVETRFLQHWGHFSLAGFCSVYQWVITCSAELSSSTGSLPCGRTVGVKKKRRLLCYIYIEAVCLLPWGYLTTSDTHLNDFWFCLFKYSSFYRNPTFLIFRTPVVGLVCRPTVMTFNINVSLQNVNNEWVWNQDWTVAKYINACQFWQTVNISFY